jgi:hypothetical protein
LIDALAIFNGRNFVIIPAVDSISATSPCEEKTEIGTSLFVEKICGSIANIKFRIAFGKCSLFVFFIFGANILAEPKVVLLISLFVCVVIG